MNPCDTDNTNYITRIGLASSQPKRILYIDDSKEDTILFKERAKGFRCVVDDAHSGEQGLALALTCDYDLILIDLVLPGMAGVDVFEKIKLAHRAQRKPIRTVAVSGQYTVDNIAKINRIGCAVFITKECLLDCEFLPDVMSMFGIDLIPT